ncbi:uncharacterized protein [Musca autumnalis]|uniref:uncharacterized protein n=1 Tax=Musca autumnalis TaxID=221902 RepID=UPI003CE99ACB
MTPVVYSLEKPENHIAQAENCIEHHITLCERINEVEKAVNHVTSILVDSYEASCPLTYPGKRCQPVWWNKSLAKLRKTSRKLYNKANKAKLSTDWDAYKEAFNKYNSEIKKAKRKPWTISDVMQGALIKLAGWAHRNGLGVNPSKTELVFFTRKRKIDTFTLPPLNGVTLELSLEAKYLGIILDHQLSWKRNVEERAKRGLIALYTCKNSIGKSWGLRPQVIHWDFMTVVRPILTYGALVWWNALGKKSYLREINRVQRAASMLITGAARSTPQAALTVLLDLTPLDLIVEEQASKSALRLKELNQCWAPNRATPRFSTERIEAWTHNIPPLDGIEVYTNGSKMENGTGAGVYSDILNLQLSFKLNKKCSVFQAEIFAIKKAAELIKNIKGDIDGPVTIYVDSQAALKSLMSYSIKSAVVLDSIKVLSDLKSAVTLCWVPGHCKIIGNDMADELARRGSEPQYIIIENSVKPPLCYFMRLLEQGYRNKASQIWQNEPGCRVSKAICLSKRRTSSLFLLKKVELRLTVGLITGHCNIRAMSYKWGRTEGADYCRLCEDEEELETIEHLLCRCPMLTSKRLRITGEHTIQSLSSFCETEPKSLLLFAKSLKWLQQEELPVPR